MQTPRTIWKLVASQILLLMSKLRLTQRTFAALPISTGRSLFPITLIALSVFSSLLIFSVSCSSRATTSAPSPAKETARWSLESYPLMPRMRLATMPCQLLPKSSITIHSPLSGVLRVYTTQPRTNLAAGFVWGEFEPEIFAAEAQALDEAKAKLEERERLQLALELPKQKLKLEREVEEAQRQVTLMNLFSTNHELAEASLKIPSQAANYLRPEAVTKAQLELGLLQQSLHYLESTNLTILGIDLPGQWSEWHRHKLEFERRQSQARLKMPFSGQLTIGLPLTDGVEEYPVNAGQELAVARDLTLIRVRVNLSNPAWAGLSTERLMAIVRLPNGQEMEAPFAFQKVERFQLREESVYYFQFPPERAAMAARLLGTDISCELWLALTQAARIVPKLQLVLNYPEAFQGRNWMQGVQSACPGAFVLVEGQTDVAVVAPSLANK
jgi:hypothetical protein